MGDSEWETQKLEYDNFTFDSDGPENDNDKVIKSVLPARQILVSTRETELLSKEINTANTLQRKKHTYARYKGSIEVSGVCDANIKPSSLESPMEGKVLRKRTPKRGISSDVSISFDRLRSSQGRKSRPSRKRQREIDNNDDQMFDVTTTDQTQIQGAISETLDVHGVHTESKSQNSYEQSNEIAPTGEVLRSLIRPLSAGGIMCHATASRGLCLHDHEQSSSPVFEYNDNNDRNTNSKTESQVQATPSLMSLQIIATNTAGSTPFEESNPLTDDNLINDVKCRVSISLPYSNAKESDQVNICKVEPSTEHTVANLGSTHPSPTHKPLTLTLPHEEHDSTNIPDDVVQRSVTIFHQTDPCMSFGSNSESEDSGTVTQEKDSTHNSSDRDVTDSSVYYGSDGEQKGVYINESIPSSSHGSPLAKCHHQELADINSPDCIQPQICSDTDIVPEAEAYENGVLSVKEQTVQLNALSSVQLNSKKCENDLLLEPSEPHNIIDRIVNGSLERDDMNEQTDIDSVASPNAMDMNDQVNGNISTSVAVNVTVTSEVNTNNNDNNSSNNSQLWYQSNKVWRKRHYTIHEQVDVKWGGKWVPALILGDCLHDGLLKIQWGSRLNTTDSASIAVVYANSVRVPPKMVPKDVKQSVISCINSEISPANDLSQLTYAMDKSKKKYETKTTSLPCGSSIPMTPYSDIAASPCSGQGAELLSSGRRPVNYKFSWFVYRQPNCDNTSNINGIEMENASPSTVEPLKGKSILRDECTPKITKMTPKAEFNDSLNFPRFIPLTVDNQNDDRDTNNGAINDIKLENLQSVLKGLQVLILQGAGNATDTPYYQPPLHLILGDLFSTVFGASSVHYSVMSLLRANLSFLKPSEESTSPIHPIPTYNGETFGGESRILVIDLGDNCDDNSNEVNCAAAATLSSIFSHTVHNSMSQPIHQISSHLSKDVDRHLSVSQSEPCERSSQRFDFLALSALGLTPIDGNLLSESLAIHTESLERDPVIQEEQEHPRRTEILIQIECSIPSSLFSTPDMSLSAAIQELAAFATPLRELPTVTPVPYDQRCLSKHVFFIPSSSDPNWSDFFNICDSNVNLTERDDITTDVKLSLKRVQLDAEVDIITNRMKVLLKLGGASVFDNIDECRHCVIKGKDTILSECVSNNENETVSPLLNQLSKIYVFAPHDILHCCSSCIDNSCGKSCSTGSATTAFFDAVQKRLINEIDSELVITPIIVDIWWLVGAFLNGGSTTGNAAQVITTDDGLSGKLNQEEVFSSCPFPVRNIIWNKTDNKIDSSNSATNGAATTTSTAGITIPTATCSELSRDGSHVNEESIGDLSAMNQGGKIKKKNETLFRDSYISSTPENPLGRNEMLTVAPSDLKNGAIEYLPLYLRNKNDERRKETTNIAEDGSDTGLKEAHQASIRTRIYSAVYNNNNVNIGDDFYVRKLPLSESDGDDKTGEHEEDICEYEMGRVVHLELVQDVIFDKSIDDETLPVDLKPTVVGEVVFATMQLYDIVTVIVKPTAKRQMVPYNKRSHPEREETTPGDEMRSIMPDLIKSLSSTDEISEAVNPHQCRDHLSPEQHNREIDIVGTSFQGISSDVFNKDQRMSKLRRPRVVLSPHRTIVVPISELDFETPLLVIGEAQLPHVYLLQSDAKMGSSTQGNYMNPLISDPVPNGYFRSPQMSGGNINSRKERKCDMNTPTRQIELLKQTLYFTDIPKSSHSPPSPRAMFNPRSPSK